MFVDGRSTYNKNLEFFLNVDRPTTDITNCLPKDGRWLRDVRRIIQRLSATDTENIISWPNEHKIGRPTNKEVYIGQENGCWTADCCQDNLFFPKKKKTTAVRRFLKWDWVFRRLQSQLYWFFCHLSYMYIVVLSFLPQNTGVIDTNSSAYISYGFSHCSNVYVNLTWPVKIRIRNSVKKISQSHGGRKQCK